MELKDVILSTLAEMEEEKPLERIESTITSDSVVAATKVARSSKVEIEELNNSSNSELIYLNSIRERLLVLFEGFQAPNNANIEAKIDMTLNFLEYTLATIDERVEKLKRGNI